MNRVEAPEMLDSDHWSAEEIACALGAIRRANQLNGGDRMHKRLYNRVVGRGQHRQLNILEVASARGEVLQSTARMLIRKHIAVRISLLDRSSRHLPQAGDWPPDLPQPTLLAGDALEIPLEDCSVDVVSCCLFFHHLTADQARAFLREALRVARVAVLVNDIERRRANYLLSRMYRWIDPSELSQHDGPTSVRRAYTFTEMREMLRETSHNFELRRGFLFRLGAILWKDQAPA